MAEAADEFLVCPAQARFRIDLQMPRDVGEDEEQIAEFFFDGGRSRLPLWGAGRGAARSFVGIATSSNSASSSFTFSKTGMSPGQSKPTFAALFCNLIARVKPGEPNGNVSEEGRCHLVCLSPLSLPP